MLKLHAGVSKKVGLPGFSSASASCTIEAELDSSLLQDHEGFQVVVRRAYEQAVHDQIARLTSEGTETSQPQEVVEVRTSPAITGPILNRIPATQFPNQPSPRPATASQVKAIRAIAALRKIGRVDLLTEDGDTLVVTDIKTSRGKWSAEQVEDSGEQLLLYSHLASEIAPGKKIATRFLVLTKTKEPVVEEHVREVESVAVKRTSAGVERVWRAIESGVFYPAPSTVTCASCCYRAACRAWAR
jgi:hypothetical protein